MAATEASTWRDVDPEQFHAAVLAAAEQLDVLPLAVEKDYWVCESLRAIITDHPGQVVFKGGTSLEKLRIIRRFSEDLDLLVIGSYPSNRAAEAALKAMVASAANATGCEAVPVRSGGSPGRYHRCARISPALTHGAASGAIADASTVLLELGQSGGSNPHQQHAVQSMLSRQLGDAGFEISAWIDLVPFHTAILHPGRTLLEKLLRINNFAQHAAAADQEHGWPRIGRQFYDIWALLGQQDVLAFLRHRDLVRETLASCYEISQAFTLDAEVPDGGFCSSPTLDPNGPHSARLRQEHEAAMRDLYYGTEEPPSFDAVLERVHEHASLLTAP